jgi:hypothetical protein
VHQLMVMNENLSSKAAAGVTTIEEISRVVK